MTTTKATVEQRAAADDLMPVWFQAAGETDAEFAMFQEYLLMGGARTMGAAYAKWCEQRGRKAASYTPTEFREVAARNRWDERVSAWDTHNFSVMRARHVEQINQAIDVLFAGAVDAAKCLVAAVRAPAGKKVDRAKLLAAGMILDRCGIASRGSSYQAPVAINASDTATGAREIVVRLEGASKDDLKELAGWDDVD
jgi:hypothetical protein